MADENDAEVEPRRYVEVLQDGAAVIEGGRVGNLTVFTDRLQSCQVEVFECTDAIVFIHDSGQLLLDDIVALLRQFGPIKKAWFASNPNVEAWKFHNERRLELRQAVKWQKFEFVRWPALARGQIQLQAFMPSTRTN